MSTPTIPPPPPPPPLSTPPSSSSSPATALSISGIRSPSSVLAQPHLPPSLSFNFLLSHSHPPDQNPNHSFPIARVRLLDIMPYEGAPSGAYLKAVEALSRSLARHNAVVIELGSEDEVVMRCALESARVFFKMRAQCVGGGNWGKSGRGFYTYRAGR